MRPGTEHTTIMRTVVYSAFLLVDNGRIEKQHCDTEDNGKALLPEKAWI